MKRKAMMMMLVAVLILGMSFTAYGRGRGQDRGFGMKGPGMGMHAFWKQSEAVEELGLTEDQIAELDDLDTAFRKQMIDQRSTVEKLQLQLDEAFSAETVDESQAMAYAEKLAKAQSDGFLAHIAHRIEISKVLTAEQREKLESMRPAPPRDQRNRGRDRN